MAEEFDLEEEEEFDFDDEFDRLREKTARTSAVYDELEEDEMVVEREGFFASITPIQRLILAVLLLLDIVVIVVGGLVLIGII